MNKLIIAAASSLIFLAACKNKINTYENKLGVRPASLAEIDTANYTKIQWADTLLNFGTVDEGAAVPIKFKFKNKGETVLFVLAVLPSCGCTNVDYPKTPIMPGDEAVLTATFNTDGHPGKIRKGIMVKTNTVKKISQNLEFTGEVVARKPAQAK